MKKTIVILSISILLIAAITLLCSCNVKLIGPVTPDELLDQKISEYTQEHINRANEMNRAMQQNHLR